MTHHSPKTSRRMFLKASAAAGVVLMLSFKLAPLGAAEADTPEASLGAFIRIAPDGIVTIAATAAMARGRANMTSRRWGMGVAGISSPWEAASDVASRYSAAKCACIGAQDWLG